MEEKKVYRTHYCGDLASKNIDEEVILSGWVNSIRDFGNIKFIHLRDVTGLVQVLINNESVSKEVLSISKEIKYEYLVLVKGIVSKRSEETVNNKLKTGELEVVVTDIEIINKSKELPFMIDRLNVANENIRLEHRYLDIRRESIKNALLLRSKSNKIIRDFMHNNGFNEVETPILCKSTPEGARDYLVPSRIHKGEFYALPQSPQLYKQMLMIGGMDRYYQIAKCFRDEDLRSDRQPEFTQLDIEMSFVDENDVMTISENLISDLFEKTIGIVPDKPFKRISYSDAINLYGADKPDLRFDMKIIDFTNICKNSGFELFDKFTESGGVVKGIVGKNLSAAVSRKKLDKIVEFGRDNGLGNLIAIRKEKDEIITQIKDKLDAKSLNDIIVNASMEDNDILFISTGKDNYGVSTGLGDVRLYIANEYSLIDKEQYNFSWVVDFPMFEYCEDTNRYVAMHHPFTEPKEDDLELVDKSNITSIKAKAYDMVINGQEVGGGSIRISNNEMQKKVFDIIGLSEEEIKEKFGFFVEALEYGTPPHGGIAFGYDRLMMILSKTKNIKDVIAFPKIQNASCLLTKAPDFVDEKQLKELGIKIVEGKK